MSALQPNRLFILCGAAAVLLACAGAPVAASSPEVTLGIAELALISSSPSEFTVRLEAKIASNVPGKVRGANYELVVEGKVEKRAQQPFEIAVGPGQTAAVSVEASGRYARSDAELLTLAKGEEPLLVALRGQIEVEAGGKLRTVDFAKSRPVRVPRLAGVVLGQVSGAKYSPERAELVFSLAVTNPNPFALQMDSLTYDLKVAGRSLSAGTLGTREQVGASSRALFDVTATLDPTTHPEAKTLIARGVVPFEMTGELVVGSFQRAFSLEGELKL